MEQYDAIIIGGGFAGIRALQTLIDSGTTTNILLLEANSYLGGRIKTTNLKDDSINDPTKLNDVGNIPIEIGGEWIYDGNDMESYLLSNGYLDLVDVGSPTDNYLSLPEYVILCCVCCYDMVPHFLNLTAIYLLSSSSISAKVHNIIYNTISMNQPCH